MSTSIVVQKADTTETNTVLANLDRARLALADARNLPDIKRIRDMAEAARVYAKAAHLSKEAMDYAAEIKLLAERKAGEILSDLARGDAGRPVIGDSVSAISEYQTALNETTTNVRTARRWQEVARVPEVALNEYKQKTQADDKNPLSTSGLIRFNKARLKSVKLGDEPSHDEIAQVDTTQNIWEVGNVLLASVKLFCARSGRSSFPVLFRVLEIRKVFAVCADISKARENQEDFRMTQMGGTLNGKYYGNGDVNVVRVATAADVKSVKEFWKLSKWIESVAA